jgi:hypothetical protein
MIFSGTVFSGKHRRMWFQGFRLAHLPISLLVIGLLWVSKVLVLCLLCGAALSFVSGSVALMRKAGQLHRFRPNNWKHEFSLFKTYITNDVPALLRSWAF